MHRLFLVFLSFACVCSAQDPWRYVDPASKIILGIRWKKLFESKLGAGLRDKLEEGLALPQMPGLDGFGGIDTVLFCSAGKAPALLVVSGTFDLDRIRKAVGPRAKRASVQSIDVFGASEKSGSRTSIALVNSQTLLVGDLALVVRALGAQPGRSSLLVTRAHQLDEHNEFWVVTSMPPKDAQGAALPIPFPIDEVKTMEMGFSVTDGAGLEISLQMTSADAAAQLKSNLDKTIKLAGKEKALPADLRGLQSHFSTGIDGEFLRISFDIDAKELDTRLRAYSTRRAAAIASARATPAPQAVVTAPPKKAVIWNMDPEN